jgi:uncharacterized protein (UPF0335 family)
MTPPSQEEPAGPRKGAALFEVAPHHHERLTEAKKEIFVEAKRKGFDVKVLREVIRVRKQDPKERDEHETLLDMYMQAIKETAPKAKAA